MVVVAFSLPDHGYPIPDGLLAAVTVTESLNVLVGHFQGGVGDFCLSLLPEGSLLRHLLGVSELHGLHFHSLGLGDLLLPLSRQGAGAGLMP